MPRTRRTPAQMAEARALAAQQRTEVAVDGTAGTADVTISATEFAAFTGGQLTALPQTQAMVNVERITRALSDAEEQSELVKRITDEVVQRHSRELDEFTQNIKGLLDRIRQGQVVNITDRQLEINTIKLPVLMYFAGNGLEQLGCEGDVAKARRSEEFNGILMRTAGTIPHRQAIAENQTFYLQLTETIYSRAYKQLKSKMEMADKIFSALKKVLSKRMLEMELSGREISSNLGEDRDDRETAGMEGERT